MIDVAVFGVPIVLASVGGAELYSRYVRRDRDDENADRWLDGRVQSAFRRFGESCHGQVALQAASLPFEIRLRNWRSPGMRVLGIRRADARNGGPVSVRSALVRHAVAAASHELSRRVQRPFDERVRERHRLMEADLEEVRRQHFEDRDARERAMREVVKRHGVTPWPSCCRGLLGALPSYLPALWSERNQTLPDRLAGIVIVRD